MRRGLILIQCLLFAAGLMLVAPAPADAASRVDIVFIIDRSSSLDDVINEVKNKVSRFASDLEASGISYRLGLVSYEKQSTRFDLTPDVETFKRHVASIRTGGNTENGLDAIMDAATNYAFELNAYKYFILIGNEQIESIREHTVNSTVQYLKSNDIKLTTIGVPNVRSQFEGMAQATGGLYLSLYDDFEINLREIFNQIQAMPIIDSFAPSQGQKLSDRQAIVPTIRVRDADNDRLTVSYYIDSESSPRETKTVSNTATAQQVTFAAINPATLAEGNRRIRFSVSDGRDTVQDSATFSMDREPPALGTVEATSTVNAIQATGSATDTVALDPKPYLVQIGSQSTGWGTARSLNAANLSPNTGYAVKFQARDAVGHIATWERTVYTKARVPAFTIAGSAEDALRLTFNEGNPGGTAYQIMVGNQYVTSSGSLSGSQQWITLTGGTIRVAGLKPGTGYSIKAKARNGDRAETAFSTAATGTTLTPPPSRLEHEESQQWIKISWAASPGASRYDIEVDGQVINVNKATSYQHSGLSPNTKHDYRVRAYTAGGAGRWSSPLSVFTKPNPPAVPANVTSTRKQTEITIAWDIAPLAERYDIEIDGRVADAGSAASYTHRGLQPKEQHTYRVRSVNRGGVSAWTPAVAVRTLPYPPAKPAMPDAQAAIYSISLAWEAVQEADGYELEADGFLVDLGNALSYVDEGLKPVTGHTYRIRAKNEGGKGPWSDRLDISTLPEKPKMPTNVMSTAGETAVTLMWYKVLYAESYEIELNGTDIFVAPDTQYVHQGLSADSSYTYRIRAKNISGYSEWSKPVTVRTLPVGGDETLSLTNIVAVVTNRSITLSWDTVAVDARYDVEVDGRMIDNGADTIYNHTGLVADEFHTYRIRLQDGSGGGQWVAVFSLSTLPDPPDAPDAPQAFATDSSIELRWEASERAVGYEIEIDGQIVEGGTQPGYTHSGLEPGTAHTYRVRAKNETGVTAWSPAIVQSTASPLYIVRTAKGGLFDLSLFAYNVQDFSEMTYVVTYNADEIELVDLYDFTPAADTMTAGAIPGSNLTVSREAGRIELRADQNIVPGTSWSGEIATLTFRSKIDGQTSIEAKAETSPYGG